MPTGTSLELLYTEYLT